MLTYGTLNSSRLLNLVPGPDMLTRKRTVDSPEFQDNITYLSR